MALAMQINNGVKAVLPILIEDCEIPGFLLDKAYSDIRVSRGYGHAVDRLAADIRELRPTTL